MRFFNYLMAIVMSAVVLAYSGGITIAKHYCKTEVVDIAINGEVEKCEGAQNKTPYTPEPSFSQKSCCSDEIASFQTFNFQLSGKTIGSDFQCLIALPFQVKTQVLSGYNYHLSCSLKSPPKAPLPIYKALERYLI